MQRAAVSQAADHADVAHKEGFASIDLLVEMGASLW